MEIKTIDQYTSEDILAFKKEDVDRLINLTLANAGVKLVSKPLSPEYHKLPSADVTLYKVSQLDIHFSSKEVAEEMAQYLRNNYSSLRELNRDWKNSIDTVANVQDGYKFRELSSIFVEVVSAYSSQLKEQIKEKVVENAKLKENYEAELKEYENVAGQSEEIVTAINERIQQVVNEQHTKERMLARFQEYFELAQGNKDVAMSFLKKAYTVSQEQADYIEANFSEKKK